MQYIFKTKATLFLAHGIFVLVWETAAVLHRKNILDACVIGTGDNFQQNVCCNVSKHESELKMKAFSWKINA